MEHSKNFATGCCRNWSLGVRTWCTSGEQNLELDRLGRRHFGQQSGSSAIVLVFNCLFPFYFFLGGVGRRQLETLEF